VEAKQLISTEATLLRATQARYDARGLVLAADVPVEADWISSGGTLMQGRISAPTGLDRGARVRVWVAADGSLHAAPRSAVWAGGQAVFAAVAGWIACGVLLLGLDSVLKSAVRRRSIRQWATEWAQLGGMDG